MVSVGSIYKHNAVQALDRVGGLANNSKRNLYYELRSFSKIPLRNIKNPLA